jgi:hypothetical protein
MVDERSSSAPTRAEPHDFAKESPAGPSFAPTDASIPSEPGGAPHVDLADPATRAWWLAALYEQVSDAIGAGLDATDPPGQRMLGRKAAREAITGAEQSIDELFAAVGYVHEAARSPAAEHDADRGEAGGGP